MDETSSLPSEPPATPARPSVPPRAASAPGAGERGKLNETWQRLLAARTGVFADREIRRAALNLLEDSELARLRREEEASSRRRAEAAEQASEARLQLALEATRMGTFQWNSDYYVPYLSPASGEVFGLLPGQVLANNEELLQLVHPEDRASYRALFRQAAEAGTDFHTEYRVLRPRDGEEDWIEERGQGSRDPLSGATRLQGVHWIITSRKQAEAARRESEAKYHTLFETIDEGYCLLEPVRDEHGHIRDLIFREVNQSFLRQVGLAEVAGRSLLQVFPNLESHWLEQLTRVAETGAAVRLEKYAADVERWFRTHYSRVRGGPRTLLAAVFEDVTERRHAEERQAFLLRLSDALRPLSDSVAVQETAMQALGRHMGVQRAFYAEVSAEGEHLLIGPGFQQEVPPLTGPIPYSDFCAGLLRQPHLGRTVAIADLALDPGCSAATKAAFAAIHVRAAVAVPLVKEGQVRALLYLHQATPRSWKGEEIALLEEVAERTWAAVERTRAEEALRASEGRLAAALAGMRRIYELHARLALETDLRSALQAILATATSFLGTGRGTVQLASEEGSQLRIYAHHGFAEGSPFLAHAVPEELAAEAPARPPKSRQVIADLEDPSLPLGAPEREAARRENIRATTSVPMISRGGELQGVITAHFDQPHQPGDEELKLVDLLAWTAADYVERHRAQETLRSNEKQARWQKEAFSATMNDAPLGECLALLARIITDGLPGEVRTAFYIADAERTCLHPIPGAGTMPGAFESRIDGFPIGEDSLACGLALPTGRPVLCRDVLAEPLWAPWHDLAREFGVRGCWSLPIATREQQGVGTFSIYFGQPAEASPELLSLAQVVAQSAAIIISHHAAREERARAEKASRQSEEQISGMANVVPDLLWSSDSEGRKTWMNDRWLDYSGQTREEALGWGWTEIIHPEDRDTSLRRYREAVAAHTEYEQEQRLRRHDGEYRWFLTRAQPLLEDDGQLRRMYGVATDIHDLRSASAAVQASEERLRTLADAVPQIIWANDGHGTANYFNQRWYEFSGLTFEESYRLGWQAIVHPEDAPASVDRWNQAQIAGEIFDAEYRLRGADGVYRWFIGRNVPMRDEHGVVAGWFGTATDMHDRKQAEEALRTSERRFRIALEAAELVTWDYDVEGERLVFNEQFYLVFGLPFVARDLSPEEFFALVHPEDADDVRDRLRRAVEKTGTYEAEFRIIRADNGEVRWLTGFGKAMGWQGDRVMRMSGVMADITERREAEAALAAAQERLRLIVESAREHAIISIDLQRRITSWNPGAEMLFGYTPAEVVGQSADLIFTPPDQAAGVPAQEATIALEQGRAGDNRWQQRKDGSRLWANGAMVPMRSHPGGEVIGFVKILRDETATQEAREALENSRLELWGALQETERARTEAEAARAAAEAAGEAKNHFLAVLSHELRTPLNPIAMVSQSLARRKDLSPIVREAFTMIGRNVQLESRLVDDLLDVTRIEHGKMELSRQTVDLHEIVQRAVELTEGDLGEKKQQLTVSLEAGQTSMEGDPARLQQVIWNLLKNASKFTPEGGAIAIRTRNEEGQFLAEVTDSGIGIEAEALPRIFQAFTQASEAITRVFGGLGLGLSIAKAIVHAHGGELRVASEGKDRGATFTVSLPL